MITFDIEACGFTDYLNRLKNDPESLTVRPVIGWAVRDVTNSGK